jgi:hypothetical protein
VVATKKTFKKSLEPNRSNLEKKALIHAGGAEEEKNNRAKLNIDRRSARERRFNAERRHEHKAVEVEHRALQRRVKVNRRRQIDPTTCERDYSEDEIEFMSALDEYKRSSGRMFPTCSEVLEVIKKLGYQKPLSSCPMEAPAPESALAATV